ncbi:hypothetical protein [Parageobacillus thermoglucosidasius]|uniref:hypothetical protein n=1 Tax=Parageobacillus thermoglucosidasius TaxID=1426 RepID=UPI001FCC538F|nr:hypothetical protein [Parageobacillus thermoglucosidasius]
MEKVRTGGNDTCCCMAPSTMERTKRSRRIYGLRKQEVEEGGYDIAYESSGKLPLQESS